ncbi:MAG: hypothetical protein WD767_07395 [Alphaproteobacteria bacterium]
MSGIGIALRPFTHRSTLYVFYDLQVSPVTFDICWSITAAENIRREQGLDDIHFVFVPGFHDGFRNESPDYEAVVDRAARRWRMSQILLPMLQFLPEVTGFTICPNRSSATLLRILHDRHVYPPSYWPRLPVAHKPRHVLDRARAGKAVALPLRAQPHAVRYIDQWRAANRFGARKLIVITLRNYRYMAERNSNIDAWARFAGTLDATEFAVVFVPDTETAMDPVPTALSGYHVAAAAAWNVGIRMALYEAAYLNLMVNNGPHGLCMFNERCRYIMFKILTESAPQTTREYMTFLGFEIGKSPPFSTRFQRWVWEDDTLSVIKREFAAMRTEIETHESRPEQSG